MPLTPNQDLLEHELRVKQMQTNLRQIDENITKMQSDTRWETRKFIIQVLVGTAAALGAGAAIGNYLSGLQPLPRRR